MKLPDNEGTAHLSEQRLLLHDVLLLLHVDDEFLLHLLQRV